MSNKYNLHIGCHRNTITSRDSTVEEYDTEKEAIEAYKSHKSFYKSIGYVVWFAEIISPDGTKRMLEQNPCYG